MTMTIPDTATVSLTLSATRSRLDAEQLTATVVLGLHSRNVEDDDPAAQLATTDEDSVLLHDLEPGTEVTVCLALYDDASPSAAMRSFTLRKARVSTDPQAELRLTSSARDNTATLTCVGLLLDEGGRW